jgi:hypothetical protein
LPSTLPNLNDVRAHKASTVRDARSVIADHLPA